MVLAQMTDAFRDDEHQAFHRDSGSTAALLIHGYPGTPAEMRPVADVLHDAGWTVRGILLPGFGADIATMADRTHQDWLKATLDNLHELQRDYERVYLVGYSMGAAISLTIAAEESVDGLILFSPFVEIKTMLWHALPVIRLIIPKIKIFKLFKPDFSDPQVREGIQTFMPGADLDDPAVQDDIVNYEVPVAMFNEIRTIGQKGLQAADAVSAPVMLFQGLQDDLVQPDSTRNLKQQLAHVVDYVEVDAGHDIINTELAGWSIIKSRLQLFVKETNAEGSV